MSDTEDTPVSAEDRRTRELEVMTLREQIIRAYSSAGDRITWGALSELLTSATVAAELPYHDEPPGNSRRALERLRAALESM